MADLDLISGDLDAVKRNAARTRGLAVTHQLDNYVAWCDYHAGMGFLFQGDFDAAIRFLEAAGERKYFHNARAAVDAMAALTIAYQSRGNIGRAASSLQSLRELVHHVDPSFAIIAESCATRLQIMQGRSEAADWETKSGPSAPKQPMVLWFEIPLMTRCRALIADATGGSLDEAQERLQIYIEFNEAHHNTFQLIVLLALQAVAFDKQNKTEEALTALERAVDLGILDGG